MLEDFAEIEPGAVISIANRDEMGVVLEVLHEGYQSASKLVVQFPTTTFALVVTRDDEVELVKPTPRRFRHKESQLHALIVFWRRQASLQEAS